MDRFINSNDNLKKTLVLTFLILANTIMLVHAAIPHHYHRGIPYLSNSAHHHHETNTHPLDQHNGAQSTSSNSLMPFHEESTDNCAIATVYLRSENEKQVCKPMDSDLNSSSSFLILSSTLKIAKYAFLPFRQKPYIHSNHIIFITQSSGLRAPPV